MAGTLLRTALAALALTLTAPASAGIWDDPENIDVLPADISPQALRATMRGFATGTGSRCYTCHVGEDENDLRTYDFAADDKPAKLKAREMLRMVNDVNAFVADRLGGAASERVRVECVTCHRGRKKPEMLHDVLARSYEHGGFDSAEKVYRELRLRYYGGFAFDFRPTELITVSENLAAAADIEGALDFLDLNLEFHPDFAPAHILKARLLAKSGETDAARASLQRAIELQPDNPLPRRLLDRLNSVDRS